MASKRKSTLDQITELLTPAPEIGSDDDIDFDTKAKVIDDFEDEFSEDEKPRRPSLKQSSALDDDPRYIGKRVSRKNAGIVEDSGNESSGASTEEKISDDGSDSERDLKSSGVEAESDAEEVSDTEDQSDEDFNESEDSGSEEDLEDDDEDEYSIMETENAKEVKTKDSEQGDNTFRHLSSVKDVEFQIEKGKAVKNQINIWDNLLECRINMQKCLVPANRLPKHQKVEAYFQEGGIEFASEMKKTQHSVKKLLNKFLELQKTLINNFSETKNLGVKVNKEKDELDEEIPSDSDQKDKQESELIEDNPPKRKKMRIDDYENVLNTDHTNYMEFRDATIQKWNDRTRVISGKISSRDFSAFEQSTLQQIRHVLSNRVRLVQRTRVPRNVGPILGEPETTDILSQPEHDPEIFDDSDFYQQLLRELIERRTDGTQDSAALGRRWAALQKLRTKMKRRIDTKASKGRRLRYNPHQKLVGFMAPIVSPNEWNEKAVNELFSSLFGKNL